MVELRGTLKHGLKVGEPGKEKFYKDYILRPAGTADILDAEDEAPTNKPLQYRTALLGRQIVKLGELSGPLDMSILRKLHIDDYDQLMLDRKKVEEMGEAESGD